MNGLTEVDIKRIMKSIDGVASITDKVGTYLNWLIKQAFSKTLLVICTISLGLVVGLYTFLSSTAKGNNNKK